MFVKKVCAVVLLAVLTAGVVNAEDLTITSFGGNGKLVFNEISNAVKYRVEWAAGPSGPWYSFEGSGLLNGIIVSGSGSVTSSVPMCYRVVAVTNTPPPLSRNMVPIPGGTNSGTDPDFGSYSLSVSTFYMDRYEVTNDEMVRVMQWAYDNSKLIVSASSVRNAQGDQEEFLDLDDVDCRITWSGSVFGMKSAKGSGYPCVEVTWYGAAAYCNYRSEIDGRTPCYNLNDWSCNLNANGYRLPTNDEWEYAARGGLRGKRFPWGDTITHSQANYNSNWSGGAPFSSYDLTATSGYHPSYDDGGYPYTSPAGDFAANGYGLYDMAGNVWEWCNDASGSSRYFRGGCWSNYAPYLRCGYLEWFPPGGSPDDFGFRSACR